MERIQRELSLSTANLGCAMAGTEGSTITLAEGETDCRKALDGYRQLAKADPTHRLEVVWALDGLGRIYSQTERKKEAEDAYLEALNISKSVARNKKIYLDTLAMTWFYMGGLYLDTNRPFEAELAYQQTLEIYRHQITAKSSDKESGIAATLNNLGIAYSHTQRPEEAKSAYQEALSLYQQLLKSNSSTDMPNLALTLVNLANLCRDRGQFEAAESYYRQSLDTYRQLAETNQVTYSPYIANTLRNLAISYSRSQRNDEAKETAQKALTIYLELAKENHSYDSNVLVTQIVLASFDGAQRSKEIETALEQPLQTQLASERITQIQRGTAKP